MTRKVTLTSKQQNMLNLNTRMLLYSSVMNALRGFTQNKQRSTTKKLSILTLTTGRSVMYVVKISLLRYLWQVAWSMFILKKKYTIAFFVILHSIKRRTRLPTYLIFMVKAMFGKLEEIKTYECSVCDARFKYKKDLTVHTRLKHDKHANLQKFHCDQCDSKFLENKSLNAHRRWRIQTMYLSFLFQFVVISTVFQAYKKDIN